MDKVKEEASVSNVLLRPKSNISCLHPGTIKKRVRDFSPELHTPVPRKRNTKKRAGKQVAKSQEAQINRLNKVSHFGEDHDECRRLVEERGKEQIVSLEPPKKSLTAYTLFVKVKRK